MADTIIESGTLARRGLMFILSSPSGAGKTTIAHRLLKEEGAALRMSVSVTTRPMRPGEVDGVDYVFTDRPGFERMVEEDAFLEYAEVFGHWYGTPRAEIRAGLKVGQDYIFDIDWQGTQQLYQRAQGDVVRVFLLPPSIEALEQRLRSRATDSDEVIESRMARAKSEISHWDAYDYVVINDDIETCFRKVKMILEAERLRRLRQVGLIDFARQLMR
ncbi:guanylate kinase [Altererythrobacter sp. B11]|uniref:guanylate kinase n=1 Tax=Altererythrobacter sp. B11 TaxID=2060312 RepID=UPI000DC711DC|nr:guanylate kinase [Altererythrobacter sp. B11]BBC74331.1 guanylate kinase [Altererythrobacter sp. B11]